jgi:predicted SprT family Zn-dependent metalloprotease
MRLLKQLELVFERSPFHQHAGRDAYLEAKSRDLLCGTGATRIANSVRVEWNSRLKTTAGRADFREKLISLNPRLCDYGEAEVDRTLRHELAHILAQFRTGRRRIFPHGKEWRDACRELAISDEARCHHLSFPISERARSYLYKCPNCQRDFPRVRRIKRAVACLTCCRAQNGGEFDPRFRLQLVKEMCFSR